MDLRRVLTGRPFALPGPVDALSERWARLPARARMLAGLLLVTGLVTVVQQRAATAEARWGGEPVAVLRATADLLPGAPAAGLERVWLPPLAVPANPVSAVPDGAVLALALPAGSVLTDAHLEAHGPAARLPPDQRALPVPVDQGWRVEPGGWVDVWVLGSGDQPSRLVARSRPVLSVVDDQVTRTALVALGEGEVAAATSGLALGEILLAHAPPPMARSPDAPGVYHRALSTAETPWFPSGCRRSCSAWCRGCPSSSRSRRPRTSCWCRTCSDGTRRRSRSTSRSTPARCWPSCCTSGATLC
jgi:hypothetical protein